MAISKKKQLEDLTARLLNLDPNIIIKKSELTPSGELIYLEVPLPKIRVCTECGSNNCNIKAREEHTFKHFPINNRRISLHIENRRLNCNDCNSSFSELPDWCIPRLRMSKDLYFAIIRDLTEVVSFRMIMRKECISSIFPGVPYR